MASKGGGKGGGVLCRETSSRRSASFHGRSTAAAAAASELPRMQMRRPKTHPDLLGRSAAAAAAASASVSRTGRSRRRSTTTTTTTDDDDDDDQSQRRRSVRVPAKVLVNVTVQRSLLGPLQLMASTEWTVEKLIDEALKQYRKEGRRPLLTTTTTLVLDPSAFGLHYSQFSLQSLDPKEKLIALGSRNFFLCPNHHHHQQPPPPAAAAAAAAAAAPTSSSSSSSSSCSGEADKTSKITIPWLRFMNFLL